MKTDRYYTILILNMKRVTLTLLQTQLACILLRLVSSDEYIIQITTLGESTDTRVWVKLSGTLGTTAYYAYRVRPIGKKNPSFKGPSTNVYTKSIADVGIVCKVTLIRYSYDDWKTGLVSVTNIKTRRGQVFTFNRDQGGHIKDSESIPVNGGWSYWGKWRKCEAACDSIGNMTRYRSCIYPPPACGGKTCIGENNEQQECTGNRCPTTTTTTIKTTTATTSYVTTITPANTTSHSLPITVSTDGVAAESLISVSLVLSFSLVLNAILAAFVMLIFRHISEDNWMKNSRK